MGSAVGPPSGPKLEHGAATRFLKASLQVSLRRLLNNWINNLRTGVGFEARSGFTTMGNSELPFNPTVRLK